MPDRNELQTLAPQKWAFPSLLLMHGWRSMRLICKRHSRATSCRHSLPSTLLFMHEWRSVRLMRKRRSRATSCRHLQVINGRSRLYEWRSMHLICKHRSRATSSRHSFPSTILFMQQWRSMRLIRKRRSRATSCRHLHPKNGRSRLYFLCTGGVPCA